MPKYAATLTDNAWLAILSNETAETNRLLRKFMKNFKAMGEQDSTTRYSNFASNKLTILKTY